MHCLILFVGYKQWYLSFSAPKTQKKGIHSKRTLNCYQGKMDGNLTLISPKVPGMGPSNRKRSLAMFSTPLPETERSELECELPPHPTELSGEPPASHQQFDFSFLSFSVFICDLRIATLLCSVPNNANYSKQRHNISTSVQPVP